MRAWLIAALLITGPLAGCVDGGGGGTLTGAPETLEVSSPTIQPGQPIPREHTCDGPDRSPALDVTGLPGGTVSVVLIVDDPDAPGGIFTHWTVWNLTASGGVVSLPEGDVPRDAIQGENDAGDVGYTGPCQPREDDPHTYRFRAFAIDKAIDLDRGDQRANLESAMRDRVLAWGELTAPYDRPEETT